jgi:hypothetical protein
MTVSDDTIVEFVKTIKWLKKFSKFKFKITVPYLEKS